MVPPAPGLFSMITGWPSLADSSLDIDRAITSVALPGVKAMTMCTGLSGQVCAWAAGAASARARAAIRKRMQVLPLFLFGGNLPADAGYVQAPQDTLARRRQSGANGRKVGMEQLAVA